MLTQLLDSLQGMKAKCLQSLAEAATAAALEECRTQYLGRKGEFTALMKEMGKLSAEERPEFGKQVNLVKDELELALTQKKEQLEAADEQSGAVIDVTLPGRCRVIGHKHPISQVMDEAVAIFRRMGFIVADGPDMETEWHNFDALNTPADHPARDVQDTFYLPDGRLLRTQTSTVQIRVMERQQPPVRIIAPGRCFRRDTPDATHSMNFHQCEGLFVDHKVSLADLKGVLAVFAREILGGDINIRFRPHFFPFTEPSLEYDFSCPVCGGKGCNVCKQSGWLEISGAGMVDPEVFKAVKYDPELYTGFAFGLGLERIAMIRYALTDIRMLYENDMRFLKQF
jgi:phenylalanyl-tRNA synthetase alpha chain